MLRWKYWSCTLVFSGKPSDKIGSVRTFFLGNLVLSIFTILLSFSNSFYLFYALSLLCAFGEILRGPSSNVIITEHSKKENRGYALGMLSLFSAIVSISGLCSQGFC